MADDAEEPDATAAAVDLAADRVDVAAPSTSGADVDQRQQVEVGAPVTAASVRPATGA